MAGGLNKVSLIGYLGADPDVRRLNSGSIVVNLRLATSETWRDKNSGERKEKTEWHNVVIFNEGLAKVAEEYLRKGALVYIEGALQTREWEKDGSKRYTTEVVLQNFRGELKMLGGKDDEGGGGRRGGRSEDRERRSSRDDREERSERRSGRDDDRERRSSRDMDDEIPF